MAKMLARNWNTAMGAVGDAVRAIGLFPGISALLFATGVFQRAVDMWMDHPQITNAETLGCWILSIANFIALFALTVPLLRIYAGGTFRVTPGIVLRMIGCFLGVSVPVMVLALLMLLAFSGIAAAIGVPAISTARGSLLGFFLILVMIFPSAWLLCRLATLWPAVALGERGPVLRRSFREMNGHVSDFAICMLAVYVPIVLASMLLIYLATGTFSVTGMPQNLELGTQLALNAFDCATSLFTILYACILSGHFFKKVRGIG